MTNGLVVAANERHVLRVFALDIGPGEAARLADDGPGRDRALGALLGLDRLDAAHVQVIDTADLQGVGLAQFLIDGDGAVEAQVAADRAQLDALQGRVMIVTSPAFGAAGALLRPAGGARLVGTYREDVPEVRFEPLPDPGARPPVLPSPMPDGRPDAGRIGLYIALGGLALLVLLVIGRLLAG